MKSVKELDSTPFITGEKSLFIVFSLIYSTLVTPIFEELISRGYVWNIAYSIKITYVSLC